MWRSLRTVRICVCSARPRRRFSGRGGSVFGRVVCVGSAAMAATPPGGGGALVSPVGFARRSRPVD
eukprot:6210707-Lingulodinium_polyedra.AAC.1